MLSAFTYVKNRVVLYQEEFFRPVNNAEQSVNGQIPVEQWPVDAVARRRDFKEVLFFFRRILQGKEIFHSLERSFLDRR